MDQKTDYTKLWRTIKGIDGRAKRQAENEAITLNGFSFSLSKQLATKFNQQFNTAEQAHFFKRNLISNKGDQGETFAQTFTGDLAMRAIKSSINSNVNVVG